MIVWMIKLQCSLGFCQLSRGNSNNNNSNSVIIIIIITITKFANLIGYQLP